MIVTHIFLNRMKGKRVRFKDLASESNFPASSGLPSDARDDLPMYALQDVVALHGSHFLAV